MNATEDRGTLKDSIEDIETNILRARKIIASTITVLGLIILAYSIVTALSHGASLNVWLTATTGVILVVIGLALLITTLLEAWLSGGQTALVDGLQAG